MTVQAAPALVAGAVIGPQHSSDTTMTAQLSSAYTVLRPFFLAGQRVDVGAVVDLPWPLAVELANAGKVTPVVAVATLAADPVAEPAPSKRTPRRPAPGTAA